MLELYTLQMEGQEEGAPHFHSPMAISSSVTLKSFHSLSPFPYFSLPLELVNKYLYLPPPQQFSVILSSSRQLLSFSSLLRI